MQIIRLVLALLLSVTLAAPARAGKAQKLLHQLETVDGAGSGLDADTVRGQTPDQIAATAVAQARAAITSIVQSAYQAPSQVVIEPGFCACATTFCTAANDLMLNCGGVFEPFSVNAELTQVSEALNPTGCVACGCNSDIVAVTLIAPATCVHTQ